MSNQMFDHRLLQDCKFAVVDPTKTELLPEGVVGATMVPRSLATSAHLMPTLLELGALTTEHSAVLLQAQDDAQGSGTPPPVALFVETVTDRDNYASHWNRMQIHRSGSEQVSWLRVHDTRVLHQLFRILTIDQRAQLFGPATALIYWLNGEWLRVERPQATMLEQAATRWDWSRIERIGLVNRALARAGVRSPAELSTQGATAERLIDRATVEHRLDHPDDLVEFAYRGLRCHLKFDEHPEIRAQLHTRSDDDDSLLADRWALIAPEVWSVLTPPHSKLKMGDA